LFDNYKNPKNSTQLIIPSVLTETKTIHYGGRERERAGRRRGRRRRFEGK